MISTKKFWPTLVLASLCTTLIGACVDNAVGDGRAPVEIQLAGIEGASKVTTYECNPQQLEAYLLFNDGSAGDFTDRVTWSSSDSGVVAISNGDIYNPAVNSYFGAGVLVPRTPGIATVEAQYLDFTARAQVEVRAIHSLWIDDDITTLGVGSVHDFSLHMKLEQDSKAVEPSSEHWTIDGADGSVSIASNTGQVEVLAAGQAQRVRAGPDNCVRTATHTIHTAEIESLSVEFLDPNGRNLTLGSTDAVVVWGHFSDSKLAPQNLSGQLQANVDGSELGVFAGVEKFYVQGYAEVDASTVTIEFPPAGLETELGPYQVTSRQLDRLEIRPAEGVFQSDDSLQLSVTGYFLDGHATDITRHVDWAVSDPSLATVSAGLDSAGEVSATGDLDAYVTISAIRSDAISVPEAKSNVRIIASRPTD